MVYRTNIGFSVNDDIKQVCVQHKDRMYEYYICRLARTVDLSTFTFIIANCPKLICCCEVLNFIGIAESFTYLQSLSRDFTQVHINCIPNGLLCSDLNITELFATVRNIDDLSLKRYPLTNNVLTEIIKSQPNCTKRKFKTCGDGYDKSLIEKWCVV
jgi:hypothetical protein